MLSSDKCYAMPFSLQFLQLQNHLVGLDYTNDSFLSCIKFTLGRSVITGNLRSDENNYNDNARKQ